MTLDKTIVTDQGDHWLIERNLDFTPLGFFRKPDPTAPGIALTPGVAADRIPDVLPRKIEYAKSLGDAAHVLDTTIPAVIDKERTCPICKDAKAKLDALIKGEAKVEDIEDANAEDVGFVRGLLRTTWQAIPKPREILPSLKDLKPKL